MKLKPGSIVKVQLPISTNMKEMESLALVYNESQSFNVYMKITPELVKAMKEQPKAFFYASCDSQKKITCLGEAAPWQDW